METYLTARVIGFILRTPMTFSARIQPSSASGVGVGAHVVLLGGVLLGLIRPGVAA